MPNKNFNARIQLKKDTEANWNTSNPVLLNGEIAIVDMTDGSQKFKIGNGTSTFQQLDYQDQYILDAIDNIDLSAYVTDGEMNTAITNSQMLLIGTGSATATTIKGAVSEAQDYADSAIESGFSTLTVDDAPVGTQFVTSVSQTDGLISVTRRVLSSVDIPNIQMSQVTGLTAALADAGGVEILVQSAQPSGQSSGDFWYQIS